MGQTVIEIVLGAIVAIVITILIEYLRKPKLVLTIGMLNYADYRGQNRPAEILRSLRINLTNKPLPLLARWMTRNAALQCHGQITFHHLDGQDVFGRSMRIRWTGSPEPVPLQLITDGNVSFIFDPERISREHRMDVHPGETEPMDIVARFDEDDVCYGWSNESYFSDPKWRNKDWKLLKDRYLAKIEIKSSGDKCSGVFRIINDVPPNAFRLENASPHDIANMQKSMGV